MGRPKALLPFRGSTFLENILDTISQSQIGHTIVVVGHHRREIESLGIRVPVVFNPNYEQGMVTSFQAGIQALSSDILGAFLFLVDHPLVEISTIEAMIPSAGEDRIVQPAFEGRRGHPVLFGKKVLDEILQLPPSEGADTVVRKDPERLFEIPVKSGAILLDIDTPEQFARFQADLP